MKKTLLNISCAIGIAATIFAIVWGIVHGLKVFDKEYDDGIEQIDLNTIYLKGSGVEVDFSEVILSQKTETRKLIVTEQNATVYTDLTDRVINSLDFDFLKKTQRVSYAGTGYFVVDLDNLTRDCVIADRDDKTVTIKIHHAYLQAIDINPNNIIIDAVHEGLLARGDIEMTLRDYNIVEKELRARLEERFNTAENGQEADVVALRMVKEVYEPVVKAIDNHFSVVVEFFDE